MKFVWAAIILSRQNSARKLGFRSEKVALKALKDGIEHGKLLSNLNQTKISQQRQNELELRRNWNEVMNVATFC